MRLIKTTFGLLASIQALSPIVADNAKVEITNSEASACAANGQGICLLIETSTIGSSGSAGKFTFTVKTSRGKTTDFIVSGFNQGEMTKLCDCRNKATFSENEIVTSVDVATLSGTDGVKIKQFQTEINPGALVNTSLTSFSASSISSTVELMTEARTCPNEERSCDCEGSSDALANVEFYETGEMSDYAGAIEICQSLGLEIAEPRTLKESDTILRKAGGFYIGAKRGKDDPNNFYWESDNQLITEGFWMPGEPNNGGSFPTESCVHIGHGGSNKWNDYFCHENEHSNSGYTGPYLKQNVVCQRRSCHASTSEKLNSQTKSLSATPWVLDIDNYNGFWIDGNEDNFVEHEGSKTKAKGILDSFAAFFIAHQIKHLSTKKPARKPNTKRPTRPRKGYRRG